MKTYKKTFLKTLKAHFPQTFSQMMAEVESHYQHISLDSSFAATSSNPIDRRLDFSAYFLTFIQTLDEQGELFERIGHLCLECGICKLFKKHNYGKSASILCEVDEVTSNLAGLQMIRSGTIANGAKKCDFRDKNWTYKSATLWMNKA